MEIGYLSASRLKNIPAKNRAAHEFCFRTHDLMAQLTVEMSVLRKSQVSFELSSQQEIDLLKSGVNPLEFLAVTGRRDLERRAAINHVALAIFSDMLHFVYGGLEALEKRKFSVAFNLLRKPFKEGLLLISWICGDEEDFFDKLKNDPRTSFDAAMIGAEKRKELFEIAAKKAKCSNFFSCDYLDTLIYDRKNKLGFAPLFDKSTHYITKNKAIATENYNINMIFKNPEDNDVYDGCYRDISLVLLFMHMMQIEIYSRMDEVKQKYITWLLFTTTALFEVIFQKGRPRLLRFVNGNFKEFLVCQHCDEAFVIRKKDAARFFLMELVECGECGMMHRFPFSWLLSKLDVDLLDEHSA